MVKSFGRPLFKDMKNGVVNDKEKGDNIIWHASDEIFDAGKPV